MNKIALIDGNSLMYRAYYATAYSNNLMKNSKGIYTNLIFSFSRMFEKILSNNYDGILIAFDKGKKTFRHEKYEEYKGTRSPMPEEMRMQLPLLDEYLDIMNIKTFKKDLYEADDIIGTIAKKANQQNIFVDIYSSDKDLLQLITDKTHICMTKKGITEIECYDENHFKEVYGLNPIQMIDLKGLMGDASDNIKGVKGIGEKTAIKLLLEYNSIENIISNIDSLKGATKTKISEHIEDAIQSKELCTIFTDVEVDFELEDIIVKEPDYDRLVDFYKEMEFHSLLKNIKTTKKEEFSYKRIEDMFELDDILSVDSSIYLELDDENYFNAKVLGVGISNEKGNFFLDESLLYSISFQMFLTDDSIEKYTFDYKKLYVFLKRNGLDISNVTFDLLLGSYILNPNNTKEEFKIICESHNYSNVYYDEEIYHSKSTRINYETKKLEEHVCKKAYAIYKLKDELENNLKEKKQYQLFYDIELPLSKVLANMEYEGIKVDVEELDLQNEELTSKIDKLYDEIMSYSSTPFNLNSVKQLGVFLFEELKLTIVKKTKTGYSTDNDTLEKIKNEHPVIEKIIEYRAYTKLKSTYLDGIKAVLKDNDIVHTIYKQGLTQTGRLSSIEPNLQNIPIKTEEGKKIRKIFKTKYNNSKLMSCDYSQIELRVLAHMANVKGLIDSFNNNEDIHTRTAMEVFNTTEPTPLQRKRAKAVNFGIVYGISSFGLANDLGITRKEADEYINKYFDIYPEIKDFMKNTIENCEKDNYVQTLFNRRRYIPDITSPVYTVREYAKRTAMNAPIQGTAADIIKIAMVKIADKMEKLKLKSKILLQVHDELIFEVFDNELEMFKNLIKKEMEEAVKLNVPLTVSLDIGTNWFEI